MDYGKYFPIRDYYRKKVMKIHPRYEVTKGDMFVCCRHDDHDPSFGVIYSKKQGTEIYHCFGCGAWGTVVDLHKYVRLTFENTYVSEEVAKKELCEIFSVDYEKFLEEDNAESRVEENDEIRKELEMRKALLKFDISDLRDGILNGKIQGRGIPYYNTLLVRMIASEKSGDIV